MCDVAVGTPSILSRAESMDKPPKGHHSVFGIGKMGPDGDYEHPGSMLASTILILAPISILSSTPTNALF